MGEWTKLVSKMIGDDVGGSFSSNIGLIAFSEDFASSNRVYTDQAELDAFWQPFGNPPPLEIRANLATGVLDWNFENLGLPISERTCTFDLFKQWKQDARGSLAAVGNWAMRFKINFGSGLVSPTTNTNEGTVGLLDSLNTASGAVQSFIAYKFSMDSGGSHDIALVTGNVATLDTPTTVNTFVTQFASDTTLYMELKRTSPTTIEGTLYSDADYSIIVEKIKVTGIASAIDDLRYMRVTNKDDTGDGNFKGTLDEVELFNESEGHQNFFTAKGNDKTPNYFIFNDLITGENTSDFLADLFVTTGWVDSGASEVRQIADAGLIECLVDADGGQDGITNDILGQTISDTAWVLRGSFSIADFNGANSSDKTLLIGMFPGTQPPTVAQDSIFLAINTNNDFLSTKTGDAWIGHSDNALPQNATEVPFTNDAFQPMLEGRFFFELKRLSATEIECTLFDERGFSFPLETIRQTIPATVIDLRFISCQARIGGATGRITMYIDSFEFWDGVTEACTFNTTPVLEQDTAQARMNYCNKNIFYSGIDDNTNDSISIDLGATLSDSGFTMRCAIDVVDNNVAVSSTPLHWIALSSSNSVANGSVSQEGIGLRVDPTTGNYNASHGFGTDPQSGWTNETDYADLTITNGKFYLEIVRIDLTHARIALYRDKDFNDLIESRHFIISASIVDLRFFKIMNRQVAATTAFWEVIVTDIRIWDNTNNVDGFAEAAELEVFTTGNQVSGVQNGHYHMNSDTQTGHYTRRNEQNNGGGTGSQSEVETFLNASVTNFSASFMDYLKITNQKSIPKYTWGEKSWNGGDGVANPPNRVEHMANWNPTSERLNKIHVFNQPGNGDFDTDSNLIAFGTDAVQDPSLDGLQVETGTFSKVQSPTLTQSVAVGFQPKALIIWGTKNGTSDIDARNTACFCWGVVDDDGNNRSISYQDQDNVNPTNCKTRPNSAVAIAYYNDSTTGNDVVGVVTLTANGFDIVYSANDANATRIHWIAYGGDNITGSQAGHFLKPTASSPETANVTTDADCQNIVEGNGVVFMAYNNRFADQTLDSSPWSIGVGTKTTQFGCIDRRIINGQPSARVLYGHSPSTSPAFSHVLQENFSTLGGGDFNARASFDGFTAIGFDVTWIQNTSFARMIPFLIIKGGKWESGQETARTTVGIKNTLATFQAKGLYVFNVNQFSGDAVLEQNMSHNIGGADGNKHSSGGMSQEDSVTP